MPTLPIALQVVSVVIRFFFCFYSLFITFYWFGDAVINIIYMAELVSKNGQKLPNVVKELPVRLFERIEIDCPD